MQAISLTVNDNSNEQLVPSFQQLDKLRTLDLLGGQQLPDTVVGSMAAFTGLTALGLDRILSVDVPSLPQSLVKATLTVDVADPNCDKDESWRLDLSRLSDLASLDFSVLGRYRPEGQVLRATRGIVLHLPSQKLLSLAVSGAVSGIEFGTEQAPSALHTFKVVGTRL